MKKQMIAFIIGLTVLFGAVNFAVASPVVGGGGDDWVIPLDSPLPFPWQEIEGIWKVESAKFSSLFSFEVQYDCDQRKILTVIQLEPGTRRVLAKGIGYMSVTREVRAAMSTNDNHSYILNVGAYSDTTTFPPRTFIALRVTSFTDWTRMATFRIQRVESTAAKLFPPPAASSQCI